MSSSPYVLKLHDCQQPEGTVYRVDTRDGERFDTVDVEPFASPDPVEWLWPGRVALGKVTVIAGAPGSGKSRLAFDLAARVGAALPWPDGTPNRLPAADVLVVSRHEEAGAAVARFHKQGKSSKQLLRFRGFWTEAPATELYADRPVAFPFDLEALEFYLENHPSVGMVIIDPLSDFCATPKLLAETLHQLHDLARRSRVALVVTVPAHCRTDAQGGVRLTSRWPTDAARCVWCLVPDPGDRSRRLFVAQRTNFCREPDGLAFRLEDAGVAWEADSAISPVDPLGELSGCEQFLRELLADGPSPAKMVYRLGAERGFNAKELRAAGARLGASKGRVGFSGRGHWEWSLAGEGRAALVGVPPSGGVESHVPAEAGTPTPPLTLPHQEIVPLSSRGRSAIPSPVMEEGQGGSEEPGDACPPTPTVPHEGGGRKEGIHRFETGTISHWNRDDTASRTRTADSVPVVARPLSKRKARKERRRLARERAAQFSTADGNRRLCAGAR